MNHPPSSYAHSIKQESIAGSSTTRRGGKEKGPCDVCHRNQSDAKTYLLVSFVGCGGLDLCYLRKLSMINHSAKRTSYCSHCLFHPADLLPLFISPSSHLRSSSSPTYQPRNLRILPRPTKTTDIWATSSERIINLSQMGMFGMRTGGSEGREGWVVWCRCWCRCG